MNIQRYALLALLAQGTLQAQTLLFDDFEDAAVNPGLWSVDLPFPSSAVSESGGVLTTLSRATLVTASGFSAQLALSGTVTLNHALENFEVCLRTDLSQFNEYWERMGIYVDFHNAVDVAGQGVPGLAIGEHTPTGAIPLASSTFTLAPGQPYQFTIIDSGSTVSLAIDGVERISATTTYAAGDRIAFFSREFPETSSSLDNISIAVVPGPSTLTMTMVGVLAFTGRFLVRHRTAKLR